MNARWLAVWLLGITGVALAAHSSVALPLFPMCAMCSGCPAGVGACAVVTSAQELSAFEATCHDTLGCDIGPPCAPGGSCIGVQGCPATESGQCTDGIDNDANGFTDAGDPNCHVHAPALTWYPMAGAGMLLLAFGTQRLRRGRRPDQAGLKR